MKIISLFVTIAMSLLFFNQTHARPSYLTTWITQYAQETPAAADTACQLCHQRSSGGNGWNEYGWQIREEFFGPQPPNITTSQRILNAFITVENQSSVSTNSESFSFLEEVTQGAQPGWAEGNVNIIRFRGEAADVTQEPPSTFTCGTLIDVTSSFELFCDGVTNPQPSGIAQGEIQLDLQTIATGLVSPVLVVSEPTSPNFVYVVEQRGTVQKVNINTGEKFLFLDFRDEVVDQFGLENGGFDERGFLGFAFDPNYANNNLVYTYISQNADSVADFSTLDSAADVDHQSVISEWAVINPQTSPAIASAERELLVIDQPQFNHNGGTITFGPEGNLFISLGDGGNRNDVGTGHGENGNGRDNTNPLGAILRIDPRGNNSANGRYGIPASNPFVGSEGVDEIYAFGFRNPFRFSIETLDNNEFNIYVGDVGQDNLEEVDLISSTSPGGNYGWNYKEGSLFFFSNPDGSSFVSTEPPANEIIPPLIDPIAEYDRDEGLSVIGGHVYTGSANTALNNKYIFAEFGQGFVVPDGRLFYLNEQNEIREFDYTSRPNLFITGFGVDNQNELYIVGSQSAFINNPFNPNVGESGELRKLVVPSQDAELCFPIRNQSGQITMICL